MRGLLDGPTAGHAALYSLLRGMADKADVGRFVDIGVFIDMLAATLDDPTNCAHCSPARSSPRPA